MRNLTYFLAGMLALASLQARAEDTAFVVSGGLVAAQGNALTLTRKVWGGHTGEAGFVFAPEGYGFKIMAYGGWGRMPGQKELPDRSLESVWGPNTYDLTHWRVGLDFRVQPMDSLPLTLAFGPSMHSWQVERVGVKEKPQGDGTWKLGWRLGAEYPINDRWAVCGYFTQTEWRSVRDVSTWKGYKSDGDTPSFIDGLNPSKPAYFTLMARYRF